MLGLLTSFSFASYSEGEGGDKTSSSSEPSQYPLLGFKDRHLEDDYLEYLVVASRARIILGYVTVILLYGLGPFAANFVVYDRGIQLQDDYRAMSDEEKEDFKERQPEGTWVKYFPNSYRECLVAWCILLLMFILGEFLITRYSTGLSVLTPSFSFPLFCRSCDSGVHVPDEAL